MKLGIIAVIMAALEVAAKLLDFCGRRVERTLTGVEAAADRMDDKINGSPRPQPAGPMPGDVPGVMEMPELVPLPTQARKRKADNHA